MCVCARSVCHWLCLGWAVGGKGGPSLSRAGQKFDAEGILPAYSRMFCKGGVCHYTPDRSKVGKVIKVFPTFIQEAPRLQITFGNRGLISY